jgi:hypothetical protein
MMHEAKAERMQILKHGSKAIRQPLPMPCFCYMNLDHNQKC